MRAKIFLRFFLLQIHRNRAEYPARKDGDEWLKDLPGYLADAYSVPVFIPLTTASLRSLLYAVIILTSTFIVLLMLQAMLQF